MCSTLPPSSLDPTLLSLLEYISGVRQLVQFVSGVQSLPEVESSQHFTADKLQQVCPHNFYAHKASASVVVAVCDHHKEQ